MSLAVELRPFRLRLAFPLRTAHGTMEARDGVLVRVTDGALCGVGEASPLTDFGTEDAAAALRALQAAAPRLTALPENLRMLDPLLDSILPLHCLAARAALECALLDLLAQRASVPLRALLAERPLAGLSLAALLGGADPAEDAARARREGFQAVKLKVAALPLEEDLARVRSVRAALGVHVALRLDANGGWSPEAAARALEALAPCEIELCEQPVAPGQPGVWPALARLCPLAADESCAEPAELETLLEAGALRAVVIKIPVLGGLLPSLRLAARARAVGAHPLVTSAMDGAVGRAAAAHLAAALRVGLASGLATGALLAEDLCADPLAPRGGRIVFGDAPGLGVAP